MSSSKPFQVGIICGSTRTPRVGPQITKFVRDTIQTHLDTKQQAQSKDQDQNKSSSSPSSSFHLEIIDIADFNLPLFDEPGIPQAITDPSTYAHAHTRHWSARIQPLDAFVFVTPQYNWGIPAALKNALDFLYHEWAGKPALVVSYGGHGGGRAAEALRVVCLGGFKMRVGERTVNLAFPAGDGGVFRGRCFRGEDLGLENEEGGEEEEERGTTGTTTTTTTMWAEEKGQIVALWEEMVAKF